MANRYCTTTSLDILMVGTVFTTTVNALANIVIPQAESEINKYLSKRYDLSSDYFATITSSIPPLVITLCERLSQGYMYQQLGRGGKEAMARGVLFIKPVLDNLELIRDYKVDLVDTAGSVLPDFENTAYKVLTNTDDYSETFQEDDPLKWKIDSDKLDDIANDRK